MKKVLSIVLLLTMIVSMCITQSAYASGFKNYSIVIKNKVWIIRKQYKKYGNNSKNNNEPWYY